LSTKEFYSQEGNEKEKKGKEERKKRRENKRNVPLLSLQFHSLPALFGF
jgi:hypothetical protein